MRCRDTEKRIGLSLQSDGRWQCRLALLAPLLLAKAALNQLCVVGFDSQRKAQIRQCVFVRAVDACCGWKGREACQRRVHLCRGALEEPPATGRKKRVAAEEYFAAKVGDVAASVPRDAHDLPAQVWRYRQLDHVAVRQWMRHTGDSFDRGTVHRYARPVGGERRDTADMIGVVMRDQDGIQTESVGSKECFDRCRVAGINDDTVPLID